MNTNTVTNSAQRSHGNTADTGTNRQVATLGPEVQKAAEEKFRKIQEAYETIKKERGW